MPTQDNIEGVAPALDTGIIESDINKAMKNLIKKKVDAFSQYRKAESLAQKANIAYLCGHQDIQVINGAIVPIPKKYRVSVIANKILPAVINDIAVATKVSPKFDVVPTGTDEDDRATAKAGQKILPYLLRINDPHLYRHQTVLWYDIAGVGWRKVYWDPKKKLIGHNPPEGDPNNIPEMQPQEPIFEGEVVCEHIPNNELVFDNRVKNLNSLQWIIHHKAITLTEVRQRFGNDIGNSISIKEIHDAVGNRDNFDMEVMGDFTALTENISPSVKPKESSLLPDDKMVNYYEFWHIPSQAMPLGAYAVLVGDVIAENRPYPKEIYTHMELPFIPAAPVSLDGIMIGGISRISQARPLQREYNQVRSMILDGSDAMGNSVFMAPRGGKLAFNKIDNSNGVYIEYDGPYKPTREQGVPLSSSLFAHLQIIRKDIDELFAFHEASRGMMPAGGPRSAVGLQVLQEADNTQLSPIVNAFDKSDEVIANQMLQLAITNYGDKLIHIVGKDNSWTLEKIDQKELSGKINVIVRTGSSLPINKSMEQERSFMLWQSGLLGNPQDPNVRRNVLNVMDLGGFDQLLEDNAKDVNFAQKEYIFAESLLKKMPPIQPGVSDKELDVMMEQFLHVPPPNMFDDHMTHIAEHGRYIKDKYWEFMGTGSPFYQALAKAMIDHANMHQQVMMMQQIQMQQMLQPVDEKEPKSKSASKK